MLTISWQDHVLVLFSCECFPNGGDRHSVGSRSACPDGMSGSVPWQSSAVTAGEVKPDSARCPGSMDSPQLLSLEPAHSRSLPLTPSAFSCSFTLYAPSHVFFFPPRSGLRHTLCHQNKPESRNNREQIILSERPS